jgi:hypothetical protein
MKHKKISKIISERVEVSEVFGDLRQEVIKITSDKLRLILHEHLKCIEKNREWIAPAGILATLIVVFPTTTFKDWIFPLATWQAIFIIATILDICWLIRSIFRIRKKETIDDLVGKIKQK